jgi:hypothetical protein
MSIKRSGPGDPCYEQITAGPHLVRGKNRQGGIWYAERTARQRRARGRNGQAARVRGAGRKIIGVGVGAGLTAVGKKSSIIWTKIWKVRQKPCIFAVRFKKVVVLQKDKLVIGEKKSSGNSRKIWLNS